VKTKTPIYAIFYAVLGPLYPILKTFVPNYVTSTGQIGRAMIGAALHGSPQTHLENRDINALG
jgi:hypothetical protein